jgi:hypothetical protein
LFCRLRGSGLSWSRPVARKTGSDGCERSNDGGAEDVREAEYDDSNAGKHVPPDLWQAHGTLLHEWRCATTSRSRSRIDVVNDARADTNTDTASTTGSTLLLLPARAVQQCLLQQPARRNQILEALGERI